MMAVKQKFLLNAKIWFSTDVGIIQVNYVLSILHNLQSVV